MSEATASDGDLDVGMEDRILAQLGIGDKPEPVAKAPAPQAPVTEAPAETQETQETAEPVDAAPVENLIEIDFKGGKYKLPSELKELHEGYLRQEDYTRKTQDVAERQKVIDLMEQQAASQRALQQAAQPYLEKLMQLNSQIGQYAQVDWSAYSDQDPQGANKHWMTYQALKERKQSIEQEMQGAAAQHLQKLKESVENLRKENSKILETKVKGWSSERDSKVRDFAAKTYGFSQQELAQVFDARLLRMMNDANEWHALQASKPAIQKQAAAASPTLKPGAVTPQNKGKTEIANLRNSIRNAKTEAGKARHIQTLLERKLG